MLRNVASISDLCIDSYLKDQLDAAEPKDDFVFFPDILLSKKAMSEIGFESNVNSTEKECMLLEEPSHIGFIAEAEKLGNDIDNWDWDEQLGEEDALDDDGDFLDECDTDGTYSELLLSSDHTSMCLPEQQRRKQTKKRMLEISASASLKAEQVAKVKEMIMLEKKASAKRTRTRKHPKKRRLVVEQKLVELIRMIKMVTRVRSDTSALFDNSNREVGSSSRPETHVGIGIISQKFRVVSLAIEAFVNSFLFVQPSTHEYIFQLVRPFSESCTLIIPSLASLIADSKYVLPFAAINSPDVIFNSLPLSAPAKFYGFSEILKASDMFGATIRFLLTTSTFTVPLSVSDSNATAPSFSSCLNYAKAVISLTGDKLTVPFTWRSTGLTKDLELRGIVSCKIQNDLVVSITLSFDPFSIIRQVSPMAYDSLLRVDEGGRSLLML